MYITENANLQCTNGTGTDECGENEVGLYFSTWNMKTAFINATYIIDKLRRIIMIKGLHISKEVFNDLGLVLNILSFTCYSHQSVFILEYWSEMFCRTRQTQYVCYKPSTYSLDAFCQIAKS